MPLLAVFLPDKPDGSAVLLAPGGGYLRIVIDKEGVEAARRLNAAGVTVFMLRYRLPGEGWADGKDVPLQDAQRAMRIVRAGAQRFGIDPNRVGVIGFSAGGHVAASLATRPYDAVYAPVDDIDAQDAKPDFAGLMYPVITMGPGAHQGSRDNLLGPNPSDALVSAYSCEKLVTAEYAAKLHLLCRRRRCGAADGKRHGDVRGAAAREGSRRAARLRGGRPRLRAATGEGQAGLGLAGPVPALGLQPRLVSRSGRFAVLGRDLFAPRHMRQRVAQHLDARAGPRRVLAQMAAE